MAAVPRHADTHIHPTSLVADSAQIGSGVQIGPFCRIGPGVIIKDGVQLSSHIVIEGPTVLGARTQIYPFASLGLEPADRKFRGECSSVVVGDDCVIRENVSIHRGTQGGGGVTRVGNGCLIMGGAHIAHDCQVADEVIVSNQALLAGHVSVGRGANIGGGAGIHQYVRVGAGAMVGGLSAVRQDVIPYGLVEGDTASLKSLNVIGLKRKAASGTEIRLLNMVYRYIFQVTETHVTRTDFRLNLPVHSCIAQRTHELSKALQTLLTGTASEILSRQFNGQKLDRLSEIVDFLIQSQASKRGLALPSNISCLSIEEEFLLDV
eukprot:GILK01008126.1.p1 GENE.GILK01008126.1~~GILK01008126.1.p1  ORF type:complete len:363 (+),score=36.32 GILK01008126.1:127-1089(+)